MKLSAFVFVGVLFAGVGCTTQPTLQYASGAAWGTVYHIKYYNGKDLGDSILREIEAVNMSLSPYQRGSLISRINAGDVVKADAMLTDVMRLSQHVCSISSGAFDPTVAPLVNLWGFGFKEGAADRPTQQQIDSALLSVGILDCGIGDDGVIKRKSRLTEFDFSAVAKGYGVDMIASMLRRNGCSDYMVEVGGEVSVAGDGPSGDGWMIQVDAPVGDVTSHARLVTLRLRDICVATSGNYRNHRTTSEGEVGHTISPVSGMPVGGDVVSATVLAPTAALADALATASMAMPLDSALAMLDGEPSVEYILVAGDDGGAMSMRVSYGADTLTVRR